MNAATATAYARQSANKLLQIIWGERGFPVDPVWIADQLGLNVIETELPPGVLGALLKDKDKDPIIVINQLDDPLHKRLNCAHKIGHYSDHAAQQHDCYKYLELREMAKTMETIEIFAQRFSLELLMPESEIQRLERAEFSREMMAQHFGVSEASMQQRLDELLVCH